MRSRNSNFKRERKDSAGRPGNRNEDRPRAGRRPRAKSSDRYSSPREDQAPRGEGKPYRERSTGSFRERKPAYGAKDSKPYSDRKSGYGKSPGKYSEERSGYRRDDKKPFEKRPGRFNKPSPGFSPDKKWNRTDDRNPAGYRKDRFDNSEEPFRERKTERRSPSRPASGGRIGKSRATERPFGERSGGYKKTSPRISSDKKWNKTDDRKPSRFSNDRFKKPGESSGEEKKWNRKESHEFYGERKPRAGGFKKFSPPRFKPKNKPAPPSLTGESLDGGLIRLNKYIANSGICSRREADDLIESGAISVNGEIITTLGYKVKPDDKVQYGGERLKNEKHVYLLLNKPKDYITTVDDPQNRKTVMALIQHACKERVYPVGRLDRNTTGLLLFTNDGDLADRLTHPSFEVQKIYEVHLDKNLKGEDFENILSGINLEDGFIRPDDMSYSPVAKSIVGIELHSGRNRIVRRIFEHFGYKVIKLDRVLYAGLTKKDLPRGKWKFLSPIELAQLKMISGNKKFPGRKRERVFAEEE